MENFPTWLPVVALALFDSRGRVLLQERPEGRHHAGLWEFPGGKVEAGETPRISLTREIDEELGLSLDPAAFSPVAFAEEGQEPAIVLFLYKSHQPSAAPQACDGQRLGWFTLEEAATLPLAPMDRYLLSRLIRQNCN